MSSFEDWLDKHTKYMVNTDIVDWCAKAWRAGQLQQQQETSAARIVQLVPSPNNSHWQGVLLGLGSDGVTYSCIGGRWTPCIPNVAGVN